MLKNLSKHSSLMIVSDTPMWKTVDGVWVFEPTLREVEWLAEMFEKITWMGYGHDSAPKSFARLSNKPNIDFIVLPNASGGGTLMQKLRIIPFIPMLMITILRQIRKNEYIHTRGPAVPALFAILISFVDRSRNYWHKYAGNWKQNPAPWAYALQRFLLRYNPHKVSVNGTWPDEPSNIVNIENPCITRQELIDAREVAKGKANEGLVNLCFVGALIPNKGIRPFIDSLALITQGKKIGHVYIAGDGPDRIALERKAATLTFNISFLGNLKRAEINNVYSQSHVIVIPSATEGFPKVIAEAAAYGCVPIVSDVSSIGQYIKHGFNGMLLKNIKEETIAHAIDDLLKDSHKRIEMVNKLVTLAELFTYERYCMCIQNDIFTK